MGVGQSIQLQLMHRNRGQAPSHILIEVWPYRHINPSTQSQAKSAASQAQFNKQHRPNVGGGLPPMRVGQSIQL
jgi:hypothetical protein